MRLRAKFTAASRAVARAAGHPLAFLLALFLVFIWVLTGPAFGYSDTWQLVINTGTTIVTFLMVFLIQHTQNRDTEAMQIKLDEIIRAMQGAHNAVVSLEDLDDEQLEVLRARYSQLAERARQQIEHGDLDTDSPDVQCTPGGKALALR
jgi:low affinity Fe/Cu permease